MNSLAELLEASLARGHWRVAVRRYVMLSVSGGKPTSIVKPAELARIVEDALNGERIREHANAEPYRCLAKPTLA